MSNLIITDNTTTLTLNRVAFQDSKNITYFNILGNKELIARGDATGNPVRLSFSVVEVEQPDAITFQTLVDSNAGAILSLSFELKQYFGYVADYNILAKRTQSVTRSEPDPTDPSTIIITTADETFKDIDFSFISLNDLVVEEDEINEGLALL